MRSKIADCAVPHLLKKANCAAERGENCQIIRRIFTGNAVIVRHFQLIFGSNWLQLCIYDVVGRPDQNSEHQKQQKHRPAWPRVSNSF